MLDLLVFGLVCVLVGVVFGGVLGWLGCAHVHDIAAKTPSPTIASALSAAASDVKSAAETVAAKAESVVK